MVKRMEVCGKMNTIYVKKMEEKYFKSKNRNKVKSRIFPYEMMDLST